MTPTIPSWSTIRLVMPECWLVIAMCAVLLVPFVNRRSRLLPAGAAVVGLLLAAIATVCTLGDADRAVLGDMLAIDLFSQAVKLGLIVFTFLVVLQRLFASPDPGEDLDSPDFLCLLLGAAVGMMLMASARNLLMIFIATEAASLPSFALAGFRKRTRSGSEGSLKYVIFGAAASSVMVYGMSLMYAVTGTLDIAAIARHAGAAGGLSPLLAVGIMAMFVGFAFKLSAVPMHFWCPDVFEGAPIEVTTFLSVASKGAAVALLLRVLQAFSGPAVASDPFIGMAVGVAVLGAVTATWGNLVAMHQDNIKRLLAYSSIAHAGYMIMGAALVTLADTGYGGLTTQLVVGALLFYLLVYLFMNLGAFTVAALIERRTGTQDIREYAGLVNRSPVLAVLLIVFLLSLFGMPGLGGFMAKFNLIVVMAKLGPAGIALIAVLLINTLLSFYYYARPIYYMSFVSDTANRVSFVPRGAAVAILLLCAVAVAWTGILPNTANQLTTRSATMLRLASPSAAPAAPSAQVPPPITVAPEVRGGVTP